MLKRAPNIVRAGLLAGFLTLALPAPAGAASVYWGANIGAHLTGGQPPYDMTAADAFEGMVGKRMSLIAYSLPWVSCDEQLCTFKRFPRAQMEAIRRRGSIPVFGWASYAQPLVRNQVQPAFKLSRISEGAYDEEIRRWAADARDWGRAFFLVFNWEMNLDGIWPYSSEITTEKNPGDFVAMWRHVHRIFRQEGATNATWVWCPNSVYANSTELTGLYPGDDVVDWTCLTAYNWSWGWRSFADMVGPTYDQVQALAPSKPVLLGETGSTEKNGSKAAWITDMLGNQLPRRFPNIKGFAWFEQNDPEVGENWLLESSPASLAAFRGGIASGYYADASFGEVSSPIPPPSRVKRCVARRSKATGRRVIVCRKDTVIRSLQVRQRIRRGSRLPSAVRADRGTFRFILARDARVTVRFERRLGRRYRAVPGAVRLRLGRGSRGISFAGRLSRRAALRPGRYRARFTATDAKGQASKTVRGTFTLVRGA